MINYDTLFDDENKDILAKLEAESAGILARLDGSSLTFSENLMTRVVTTPNQKNFNSPLSNSLFGNSKLQEVNGNANDDDTTYVIFRGFESEEQLNRFFIGAGTDSKGYKISALLAIYKSIIICCYKYFGDTMDNCLAIRMSSNLGKRLSYLSKSDLADELKVYADKIVEFGANDVNADCKVNFYYEAEVIIEALSEAVPHTYDKLRTVKGLSKDKEALYETNYKYFLKNVENSGNAETEQAIRRLCALLVKLDYDGLETYQQQTSAWPVEDRKKMSLANILASIRALQKTSSSIKYFQTNNFNNQDEVINYVNKYFVDPSAIGAESHFVINFPFIKLSYERRKTMIQLFLRNGTLEFSGFFAGAHFDSHRDISAGDIVYNLLITATDKDRLKLVQDLDNGDNDLFYLLSASSGDCFMTISFIVGCALLGTINSQQKQNEAMINAISEQNYFFYNDYDDSKIQNYNYDEQTKLIKFENKGHRFTTEPRAEKILESEREQIKERERQFALKEQEYIATFASPKIFFNPLDFILITAESDLKSDMLKALFSKIKDEAGNEFDGLKKDGMVLLPACIVYLIFKEYHDKNRLYTILAVTTLLFLPFGIGALIASIEAASVLGIIVAATDITFDVAVLAVNSPEAIENNKERAEFVNTLAFFYALARLPSALVSLDGLARNANKNLVNALKFVEANWSNIIQELRALFRYDSRVEALFREIFKLINKGEISEYQFLKLAKKMKAEAGIDMHLVDATSKDFKELYKAWKESPVYAVFHSHSFKNGRYGLILDGPAIYFFRGGDFKLASYTVQHELIHVKLWYNLVKEYGKKGGLAIYNKIPNWLHEADVIGEILKQNKQKPGKWSLLDIENDLGALNYNIKTKPKWSNSFKEITKKEFLTLKDMENWDITKWLK